MDASLKKILRSLSLALRHELEGWRDENGVWRPGDLERRLAELGIHRDKSKPLDEMPHLSDDDRHARIVVDGYLQLRADAGVERGVAVAEFVRESAYTWANRLLALRCMEARSIIEEIILQKAAYAGRSLVHHRFLRKDPSAAAGGDDGLFAVLFAEFAARTAELPALFDPHAAAITLRPSVAALKRCVALLSGTETVRGQQPATDEVFSAPDAFGWAYQYWNAEEKDRVFEAVRTQKGTKIEGADIIPATQLYTEPYMVKFLVQNSLGALWMGLHPESRLCDRWEFYVRDTDRAPVEAPPSGRFVRNVTLLDPALGSGHFHLEAFDLLFAMYGEENPALTSREIAASILNRNLFGIDLDERAVQIAEVALWMKAKDAAPELKAADLNTFHDHLVATNIRLPRGRDHLEAFLCQHPEDAPLRSALELVFRGLEHADELGSLLQIEEPVDRELRRLKAEADAAGTKPPVQPDMFRATAVQSALPLGVESYEAWKAGALERLKAHFEQEAEAADSLRAFFGVSARKGLALFDLFARRYDIVAANPPYMGSRQMGQTVKEYVALHFPETLRDLCVTFIAVARRLLREGGTASFVAQQSWLFSPSFAGFRHADNDQGVLDLARLTLVARLGEHAFSEGAAGAVVAMFLLQLSPPPAEAMTTAVSLAQFRTAAEKEVELRTFCSARDNSPMAFRVQQVNFRKIPGAPVVFWVSEPILNLFSLPAVESISAPAQGLKTGHNDRFIRTGWEVATLAHQRWKPFVKGEGFRKWTRGEFFCADWEHDGIRMKEFNTELLHGQSWSRNITNTDKYFRSGLVYTYVARGKLSLREVAARYVVDAGSPLMVVEDLNLRNDLLGYLNTRTACYLARLTSQNLFNMTGVRNIPTPSFQDLAISDWAKLCVALQSLHDCSNLLHEDYLPLPFQGSCIRNSVRRELLRVFNIDTHLLSIEALTERIALKSLRLDGTSSHEIFSSTGKPAGLLAITLDVRHTLPVFEDVRVSKDAQAELLGLAAENVRPMANSLRIELRQLYSSEDSLGNHTDESDVVAANDADVEDVESAEEPLPPENFLDSLSQRLGLHPISVFWLLKEGIEQDGWPCPPEERRLTEDRFTVLVLHLLGHRWPKQIETGEPVPHWADRDGVIPLSPGSSEPTLAARVLERLGEEFPGGDLAAIRAEFEQIVGAPLEVWTAGGFFTRHIPQFKKRPIAWQLQSQPVAQQGQRRSSPAGGRVFSCLVYYHRLDADLLPKLRSHYLAVIRTAHETELRTLEALAKPTPDQGARKAELEVLVDELNGFDATLQAVVETGFGPTPIQPRLRQIAVEDAMLAMKARWLARLRDTLQAVPLPICETASLALGHHADFPRWIATAVTQLPHHCAKAGAKSPDATKFPEDPTPTTLTTVICAETDAMTATALDRACAEWEHVWDTHVIDPLRARISAANSAIEALDRECEALDGKNYSRMAEIDQEQKRLRTEVRAWKREIKDKTGQAGVLASRIRTWSSPELATWETWLASTPLFDEISSLDGRRAVPATIRDFIQQESLYAPDLNDGVRVNIAPLQRAGLLAAEVLAAKDVDKAIADRAEWRADERRWVREGRLPQPGWWPAYQTDVRP